MRSRFLLTAAVPALLLLAAAPAHAVSDPEGQRTFTTAGCGGSGGVNANEFTVPLGVTELTIEARGAAGKGSGSADGGDGLELTHELSVTKGDKFYFCVDEGAGVAGVGPGAAAGGGYTLVSRNADLSNPMMIAGGGGGASSNSPNAASGGPAGFPLGIAGSGSIGSTLTYGTGATSSVPGVGGTSVMPTSNGENGSGRDGGDGGESMYAAGGGAGGGYFGGGGGAGSVDPVGSGGGGGGGSSFCSVSPCPYTWSSSETAQVKLTWDPTAIYKFDPVTPFGTLEVGTSSAPKPITFRNVGTETMIFIGPPMLIGDHASDFAVSGSACSSGTLAPDATCTIDVVFTPSGAGKRTAVLIPHSSNGAGALPTVSGTGGGDDQTKPPVDDTTPVPPTPPVTSQPPVTDAPKEAAGDGCSRRVVELSVPRRYRSAVRKATASVAGKTVATFRGDKARVDLSGRGAGKVRVKITMKLRGGRTRTDTRTYSLCVSR